MKRKILLLYDMDYVQANTVSEHVAGFSRHSSFDVTAVNVHPAWKHAEQGHEPSRDSAEQTLELVRGEKFSAVILHYTLFGMNIYYFGQPLLDWLGGFQGLKIAFFQDEYHQCTRRFRFIDEYGVDVVYTLVEPRFFRETYLSHCSASCILHTIPGFVEEDLVATARTLRAEGGARDIDVGYRGRIIDFALGRAGREKHVIGEEFKRRAANSDMALDIESADNKRIYGPSWPWFLARCRCVLGVEAGVSLFDVEDKVRLGCMRLRCENPNVDDETLFENVMRPWEDVIPYRMISPRHFEAAAMGCCQVLFEGRYSGILEPGRHYIELKKDFSNICEVISKIKDKDLCRTIAEQTRKDLVESGRYSYQRFIAHFDACVKRLL